MTNETSPVYDGLVLSAAVKIVQRKTRLSIKQLADLLGRPRTTVHRWKNARPLKRHLTFERNVRDLSRVMETEGIAPNA